MRTLVRRRGGIAVYVVLTLGSVVMIAPFVFNLSKSLQTAPHTFAFPFEWIPDPFTWFNYTDVSVFMSRQFFRTVPRGIYEAGILDGAGPIRVFRSLYAPLAGPTVAAFVIVSFLAAWNLYAWPFLAVADPDLRVVTLHLGIAGGTFNSNSSRLRPEILSAMSLLSMIPVMAVFMFMQRRFVESIARSG